MKKTGKQQSFTHLRSHNLTHLHHEPIGIQSTCRIGVGGLRTRGNSRGLTSSLREAALLAFDKFVGPKLLLMAGYLGFWPASVDDVVLVAQDAHVPILFETKQRSPKAAYMAVLPNGQRLPLKIYQKFATSKDANRQPELVRELVKQCGKNGERTIHICGITLGLLICGENNVLSNEQSNRSEPNRPYVRFHAGLNLFGDLRLVFNGAHTKMGNWGKLERRFEFLSSGERWALYATNNSTEDWGASTLRAYYNGFRIATSEGPEPNCEVPASILTSKNDRCRILTLDIPGSLLQ